MPPFCKGDRLRVSSRYLVDDNLIEDVFLKAREYCRSLQPESNLFPDDGLGISVLALLQPISSATSFITGSNLKELQRVVGRVLTGTKQRPGSLCLAEHGHVGCFHILTTNVKPLTKDNAMVSEYERRKLENIQKNKDLLGSLGLDAPFFEPKAKRVEKIKENKKRKSSPTSEQSGREEPAPKPSRTDPTPEGGPRRSARNAGKPVDYNKELSDRLPRSAALTSGIKFFENEGPQGQGGKRTDNPKTYGHIPGVEIGTWWQSRRECSEDAIHAPWVGGIATGPQGAYSIALSGGYEDDVDLGYAFTYTGSGGRDLRGTPDKPKNLRTGPQSFDQTFETIFNKALLRSSETMKPVRVVRGFKVRSKYAPYEGYRYDGLYRVEKAWEERGDNGFMVCKYAFKRIAGQPPLPVREDWCEDDEIQ